MSTQLEKNRAAEREREREIERGEIQRWRERKVNKKVIIDPCTGYPHKHKRIERVTQTV